MYPCEPYHRSFRDKTTRSAARRSAARWKGGRARDDAEGRTETHVPMERFEFRVSDLLFEVQGLGFRVQGLGFGVQGLGFRV